MKNTADVSRLQDSPSEGILPGTDRERKRGTREVETHALCTKGLGRTEDGFRLIWIRSPSKAQQDEEARTEQLEEARAALKDLAGKLNQRNLRTRRQIKTAVNGILKEYECQPFIRVTIIPRVITTYKRTRTGRPKPGDPRQRVSTTEYDIEVKEDAVRLRQERNTDEVFPLVTNLSPIRPRNTPSIPLPAGNPASMPACTIPG